MLLKQNKVLKLKQLRDEEFSSDASLIINVEVRTSLRKHLPGRDRKDLLTTATSTVSQGLGSACGLALPTISICSYIYNWLKSF